MAIETLRNSSTLEVVGGTGIKVKTETIDSGFVNERKRFNISGKTQLNKPTIIGTLKLTASENRRFLKAPGINKVSNKNIELNSNLRLSLTSVERNTNNNIILYSYNLVYTSKENINKLNKLNYTLLNNTTSITTKLTGIENIDIGRTNVNKNGEFREIKITGTPGTTFKIAVNKIQTERSSVEITRYDGKQTLVNEASILSKKNYNSTYNGYNIIDGKLDYKGKYSFYQRFPKVTDTNLTTDGLGKYTFNILPASLRTNLARLGFGKNREGWSNWYTKIISQIYISKLTIRATSNNVLYTINRQTVPGGASTQTYNTIFKGSKNRNVNKITYILKAISSSHAFALTGKTPTYSTSDAAASDWSNTIPQTNGGALVDIRNITQAISTSSTTTGWTNDTYTISFDIEIRKKPLYSDLIMTAALNAFVNCS